MAKKGKASLKAGKARTAALEASRADTVGDGSETRSFDKDEEQEQGIQLQILLSFVTKFRWRWAAFLAIILSYCVSTTTQRHSIVVFLCFLVTAGEDVLTAIKRFCSPEGTDESERKAASFAEQGESAAHARMNTAFAVEADRFVPLVQLALGEVREVLPRLQAYEEELRKCQAEVVEVRAQLDIAHERDEWRAASNLTSATAAVSAAAGETGVKQHEEEEQEEEQRDPDAVEGKEELQGKTKEPVEQKHDHHEVGKQAEEGEEGEEKDGIKGCGCAGSDCSVCSRLSSCRVPPAWILEETQHRLGTKLYWLVHGVAPAHAAKVTGLILDTRTESELEAMLEDEEQWKAEMQQVLDVLPACSNEANQVEAASEDQRAGRTEESRALDVGRTLEIERLEEGVLAWD